MKSLIVILVLVSTVFADTCDQYYTKFDVLIKQSRDHAQGNRIISELNTLDQAKYWLNKYIECKDKRISK